MSNTPELVRLIIDDVEVRVPKGTNLIEAAKQAHAEIPYYCYHKHLSIAGNCRMCQVQIEGQPKLSIACNTTAQEGMVVRTQKTSEEVGDAQRATLEFLLINHPLDCTVCDQAGHCKLQDYYYQYNAKSSRFIEEKVHKVKALPLGPEVVYDGERCILCTRCVRFCDEITGSGELGVYNRGDHAVIGVHSGRELDNPLSGSVVDLCPVGALTHRRWRFNTRIWYTGEADTICVGCSTGCNVKVQVRDDKLVHVKARLNSEVNQEWLCDEGRYGFERFVSADRISSPLLRAENELEEASLDQAIKEASKLQGNNTSDALVFLSPFLTLEETWLSIKFAKEVMGLELSSGNIVTQIVGRDLTEMEKVLVSPDYAPNARALQLLGFPIHGEDWRRALNQAYRAGLDRLSQGGVSRVLLIGEFAIRDEDLTEGVIQGILNASTSVALSPRHVLQGDGLEEGPLGAHQLAKVVFPVHGVYEKNGVMVSESLRLQQLRAFFSPKIGSQAVWSLLSKIAGQAKRTILSPEVLDERSLFRAMVQAEAVLSGLTLKAIGKDGIALSELHAQGKTDSNSMTA